MTQNKREKWKYESHPTARRIPIALMFGEQVLPLLKDPDFHEDALAFMKEHNSLIDDFSEMSFRMEVMRGSWNSAEDALEQAQQTQTELEATIKEQAEKIEELQRLRDEAWGAFYIIDKERTELQATNAKLEAVVNAAKTADKEGYWAMPDELTQALVALDNETTGGLDNDG